ncbi:prohibitin family protein [Helicobacter japonicus]|uniref:Prohibitin family protein n=3 Tax=Helicobacter japonicus TaxID=425400 RepID=A0A4U8TVU3_9HELI|nr:prohibitin family protein [Helicobacter japonicus]TLE03208.1 prohibitin family protein [Helicobacter japonicus]
MPIDLNEHLKKKRAQNDEKVLEQKNDSPRGGGDNGGRNRPNNNNGNNNRGDGGFNLESFPMPSMPSGKSLGLLIIVVLLIVIFIAARPFVIVNAGEVGIKVTTGKYDPKPLDPGLHFFVPIIQNVIIVDTKVRTINFSRIEDMGNIGREQSILRNDAINVMDTSGMTISIELTVQYQLEREKVPATIAEYGTAWEQKIINPVIRDVVRSAVGNYPTEELPTKRDEVASLIYTGFKSKLDATPNQPVKLVSIQLREIVLPEQVKTRIEGVELAKRDAQKAKEEANALRERAKGKADALEIEARGQSEANRLVNESLSQRLLELRQIETQGKFNEALKENNNAQIFLTPGGAVPNIWVDSKSKQKSAVVGQ